MKKLNTIQTTIATQIQDCIKGHHIALLTLAKAYDLLGGLDLLCQSHLRELGQQHGFEFISGNTYHFYIYLKKDQTPKVLAPFSEEILNRPGWTTRTTERNGGTIEYRFSHEEGFGIVLDITPHSESDNCRQVQVGTTPVYEWRCIDNESNH